MDWKEIKTLLRRASEHLNKNSALKQAAVRAVEQELKILLPEEAFTVKGRTIVVRGHPALKQELALHKAKILKNIQQSRPHGGALDIR